MIIPPTFPSVERTSHSILNFQFGPVQKATAIHGYRYGLLGVVCWATPSPSWLPTFHPYLPTSNMYRAPRAECVRHVWMLDSQLGTFPSPHLFAFPNPLSLFPGLEIIAGTYQNDLRPALPPFRH